MATIHSLPSELLLEIFELLAAHGDIKYRYRMHRMQFLFSKAQIRPCSLVSKRWRELSLPVLDRRLTLSRTNVSSTLSFVRQAKARRSHIKCLLVKFPESAWESTNAGGKIIWDALKEVLEIVGEQLLELDVMLWSMAAPGVSLLRLPSNLEHFHVLACPAMRNPPFLQNWFTGLDQCKALRHLKSSDVVVSQSTPAQFKLSRLQIDVVLPLDSQFFSASAGTLTSLIVSRSPKFTVKEHPTFWPEVFQLLHLVRDSLRSLNMTGYLEWETPEIYINPQLVAPILPRLRTLTLVSDFLGNLVDSFPRLDLSSELECLRLSDVRIMSKEEDGGGQKLRCNFRNLHTLSLFIQSPLLSTHNLRPIFDPATYPVRLKCLEIASTSFVSTAEVIRFLEISQPQKLTIDLDSSFELLNFLLTSGHTIPGIEEVSISANFYSAFRHNFMEEDDVHLTWSSFNEGTCMAKRLQFDFETRYGIASCGNGGYGPLISFLRAATWTDQLEKLTLRPGANRSGGLVALSRKEWADYGILMTRLKESRTKVELECLEFYDDGTEDEEK
ncbi:hypothetical protein BT69DRAFT_1331229 [Atractiella rhizophila]|nr:hypothetical protein BT69DRAFT_1331229 [Atractiella rhizophila]